MVGVRKLRWFADEPGGLGESVAKDLSCLGVRLSWPGSQPFRCGTFLRVFQAGEDRPRHDFARCSHRGRNARTAWLAVWWQRCSVQAKNLYVLASPCRCVSSPVPSAGGAPCPLMACNEVGYFSEVRCTVWPHVASIQRCALDDAVAVR